MARPWSWPTAGDRGAAGGGGGAAPTSASWSATPSGSCWPMPTINIWGKCDRKTAATGALRRTASPCINWESISRASARSTPACRNCATITSACAAGVPPAVPGGAAARCVDNLGRVPPAGRFRASACGASCSLMILSAKAGGSAFDLRSEGAAARGAAFPPAACPGSCGWCAPPSSCACVDALVLLNGRPKKPKTEWLCRPRDGPPASGVAGLRAGVSLPARGDKGELGRPVLLIPDMAQSLL